MKRSWPLILITTGLILLVGGFIYDVMFAGIPYQDPTPEMSALYSHHAHIASALGGLGAAVILAGTLAGIIRIIVRSRRPPTIP